jgi:hypothetical protein
VSRSSWPDDQPARAIQGHPVGRAGERPDGREPLGVEGEPVPVQGQPLDRHLGEARRQDAAGTGQGGEVQGVLRWHVDGSLVGVDLHHPHQPRIRPQDSSELGIVCLERALHAGRELVDYAGGLHLVGSRAEGGVGTAVLAG